MARGNLLIIQIEMPSPGRRHRVAGGVGDRDVEPDQADDDGDRDVT